MNLKDMICLRDTRANVMKEWYPEYETDVVWGDDLQFITCSSCNNRFNCNYSTGDEKEYKLRFRHSECFRYHSELSPYRIKYGYTDAYSRFIHGVLYED